MSQLSKVANAYNPVVRVVSALNAAQAARDLQAALASDVFAAIERRMQGIDKNFSLRAHVAGDLVAHDVLGDGVEFRAVDSQALIEWFRGARVAGEYVFADPAGRDAANIPLRCSMGASKGIGFREIRGLPTPPYNPYSSATRDDAFASSLTRRLTAKFGDSIAFDLTSLHAAIEPKKVKIHVDTTGFMLRGFGGLFMSLDAGQHTGDELIWQYYIKGAVAKLPWAGDFLKHQIERIHWIWPNSANGYMTSGLSLRDAGVRAAERISDPALRGAVGLLEKAPIIPGALSYDVFHTSHSRTQIVLSWSDGYSAVVSTQGRW